MNTVYSLKHQRALIDGQQVHHEIDTTIFDRAISIRCAQSGDGVPTWGIHLYHEFYVYDSKEIEVTQRHTVVYDGTCIMRGMVYHQFTIDDTHEPGDEVRPLPGEENLQDISPQNRRTSHAHTYAANKVSHL